MRTQQEWLGKIARGCVGRAGISLAGPRWTLASPDLSGVPFSAALPTLWAFGKLLRPSVALLGSERSSGSGCRPELAYLPRQPAGSRCTC